MQASFWIRLNEVRIAVADLTSYHNECYIINRINVPRDFRGRGHASELLRQILVEADDKQQKLVLEVSASDGLTNTQLRAWYRRHGFVDYVEPSGYTHINGMLQRLPTPKDKT